MPLVAPILQLRDVLIVPIQGELTDRSVLELQSEVLGRIEKTGARGVVLEIGALDFVDSFMARVLDELGAMAGLMGTRAVLVGMRPEVALVLMDLGLQAIRMPTARNLEQGLAILAELLAEEEVGHAG